MQNIYYARFIKILLSLCVNIPNYIYHRPNMFVHIIVFLDFKLNRVIIIFFFVIRHLVPFEIIIFICEIKVRTPISTNTSEYLINKEHK